MQEWDPEWIPGFGIDGGEMRERKRWGKMEDGFPWDVGQKARPQRLCLFPHFPREPACVRAPPGNNLKMGQELLTSGWPQEVL